VQEWWPQGQTIAEHQSLPENALTMKAPELKMIIAWQECPIVEIIAHGSPTAFFAQVSWACATQP